MRIDVPWGTGTTPVELDPGRVAGVLGASVAKAEDPEGILRAAIARQRFQGVPGRRGFAAGRGGERRYSTHTVGRGARCAAGRP